VRQRASAHVPLPPRLLALLAFSRTSTVSGLQTWAEQGRAGAVSDHHPRRLGTAAALHVLEEGPDYRPPSGLRGSALVEPSGLRVPLQATGLLRLGE
jgi:hypothetical protein